MDTNRVRIFACLSVLTVFLVAYWTSYRLILSTILLLSSLLTIFKSPTYSLWKPAVIVSEYSIMFVGLTCVIILSGFFTISYTSMGTAIGIAAVGLFLYPLISAYLIGQHLPTDLKKAFRQNGYVKRSSGSRSTNVPFSINKLFQTIPKVSFQTFTYVTYDEISLTLDYYRSAISGRRPCVVVVHGGSWTSGDSKQLPELNSHLAQLGYHVAAITYRLAPKWQNPAPIEDLAIALKYLRERADQLDIDVDNFVLLGRSAGGQIALLSAYTLARSGVKGVINFYGPADMIWGYQNPVNPLVMDSRKTLAQYLGGSYPEIPDKYVASSPIEFVNRKTVPTLSFHGQTDALVYDEHAHRLDMTLAEHGIPHYFLRLPWVTYGFDYNLNGPGGQLSTYAIEYFLRTIVG